MDIIMIKKSVIVSLMVFISSFVFSDESIHDAVDRLLTVSGSKTQVSQYPSLFKAQLEVQKNYMEFRVYNLIEQSMMRAFADNAFYTDMTAYLEKNASVSGLKPVLDWYNSPLAKKMVDLEVKMTTPEEYRKMSIYAMKLQTEPPSDERMMLVQKLDAVLEASQLSKQVLSVFFKSFLQGFNAVQIEGQKKSAEELEAQLKNINEKLDVQVKGQIMVTFLYMYNTASDDELREYISFYETQHGHYFSKLMSDATIYSFEKYAQRYGTALAEILKKELK